MKKRWSKLYSNSTEELIAIVKASSSLTEILSHYGLKNKGGYNRALKQRLHEENIDYSHIPLGRGANLGKTGHRLTAIPIEVCMVENSTMNPGTIKKKVMQNNLLPNQCALCDDPPFWKGKPLVMVLDHINGINNDHRLENLRLLCPNCNSQTDTFCRRNVKKNDLA